MSLALQQYQECWINSKHIVLGRKLKPFSLWHKFWLELIESPLLFKGNATLIDLALAVRVCRIKFNQIPIRPNKTPLRDLINVSWHTFRNTEANELQKFQIYLADYYAVPELWLKPGATVSDDGFPETLRVAAWIMDRTGWSEQTVWDLPIGRAYWYSLIFWRFKGSDFKIVSEDLNVLEAIITQRKLEKEASEGIHE